MRIFRLLLILSFISGFTFAVSGQNSGIPLSYDTAGAVYRQDFDALPFTGSFSFTGKGPFWVNEAPLSINPLNGWQLLQTTGSKLNFAVGTGSATGNAIYSLGNAGSTDRALGSLSTGTGIYAFGVLITNHTGRILNTASIRFTAEQWRKGGSGNVNTWYFTYKTGLLSSINESDLLPDSSGNFRSSVTTTGGGSLNGDLAIHQQNISFQLENLLWMPDEQLLLRWDDADEPGSDDVAGIDNFEFSSTLSIQSPDINQDSIQKLTSTTATISCLVNDHFADTRVQSIYSTDSSFAQFQHAFLQPDTLKGGTGPIRIEAYLTSLLPRTRYFARFIATNQSGSDTGSLIAFRTPVNPPVVSTLVNEVFSTTANMGGRITTKGDGSITERGILWALDRSTLENQISIHTDEDSFAVRITDLPSGRIIHAVAYLTYEGGTVYGDTISFLTANTIISLRASQTKKTRDSLVVCNLKTSGPVAGFHPEHFSLIQKGISHAEIKNIKGVDSVFTIEIATGSGDGYLRIALISDSGLTTPISNLPFFAEDSILIDKTPPIIRDINLPDATAKIGDTIPVNISLIPEPDTLAMFTGFIDNMPLFSPRYTNDSTLQANCVIREGGKDRRTGDSLPVSIQLEDAAGNHSFIQKHIVPKALSIDAQYPSIKKIQYPLPGWYKTDDSLEWSIHFTEPVLLLQNDEPKMTVTLGTRSRSAQYVSGAGSDSLLLRYIIQNGDKDLDGIKIGNGLITNGISILDSSGNPAKLNFTNLIQPASVKIDAVAPEITSVKVPAVGKYFSEDTIGFQVQFSKAVFLKPSTVIPVLFIRIGNSIKAATYYQGTGTKTLVFVYRIHPEDTDTLGIKVISPLADTLSCLADSLGNPIQASLHNIDNTSGIQINPSTIQLMETLLPEAGIYHFGETLSFSLRYNEPAYISGTTNLPSIKIRIGKNTRYATYSSGSGTNILQFNYQIQKEDEDSSGIIISPFLILNSGGIKDSKGYFAPFILNTSEWVTGIKVDAVAPVIVNVVLPDPGVYRTGDTLVLQTVFSEPVKVLPGTSTPQIKITFGNLTRYCTYQSGSGTNRLRFIYQITYGDLNKNGIKINNSILTEKNQVTDFAGNPATTGFTITSVLPQITIDGIAPVFTIDKTDTLRLCENQPPVLITDLFAVSDEEAGELISWRIKNIPELGTLSDQSVTLPSTGKKLLPTGWFYQPFPNHTGWDSLVTEITDGVYTTQKSILIHIQPRIQNNMISHPQTLCTDQLPDKLSGSQPVGGTAVYTYVWETANTSDSLDFRKTEKDNEEKDYSPTLLSATTWIRRTVSSGACMNSSNPIKIAIQKEGYWKGDSSQSWADPSNWCQAKVPGVATNVFIDSGRKNYPVISSQAACGDITLSEKTHLTIDGILQISGKISAPSHSIDATKGGVYFAGDTIQFLSGKLFHNHLVRNLYIHTRGNVHITDSVSLTGRIYLQDGDLYTHDLLSLSGSAGLAPVVMGSEIKGETKVTIALQENRAADRLLAHPFSHSIHLQQLTDSIDIMGEKGSINGFTNSDTNQPSAFWFDPVKGTELSGFDSGWMAFTNTHSDSLSQWKKQTGIRVLIRGKKGQGLDGKSPGDGNNGTYLPANVSLRLSGNLTTGDQEIQIPVNQTPAYQVVGNPYLAAIDLSRVYRTENTGKSFWIWNPLQGIKGGYSSYPFSKPFTLLPFRSFIVKANKAPFQTLLITENCKTEHLLPDSFPVSTDNDEYGFEIRLFSGQIFWDRLLIRHLDSARAGIDKFDAEKINNPDVNFFSLSKEGQMLSMDARYLQNSSRIQLGITHALPGLYQLKMTKINLPPANTLQLYDNYLQQWASLTQDEIYSFEITGDTATQGINRFEIKSPVIPGNNIPDKKIQLHLFPVPARDKIILNYQTTEPGNTTVRILHLSGKPVRQESLGIQQSGQVSLSIANLISGVYLLEFRSGQLIQTRKFYKY